MPKTELIWKVQRHCFFCSWLSLVVFNRMADWMAHCKLSKVFLWMWHSGHNYFQVPWITEMTWSAVNSLKMIWWWCDASMNHVWSWNGLQKIDQIVSYVCIGHFIALQMRGREMDIGLQQRSSAGLEPTRANFDNYVLNLLIKQNYQTLK